MKTWKIGSDIKNDLIINDPNVDKHHAELLLDGTTIIIRDLSTQKGTFVNDWRIKQKVIQPTDKLMIGREWIDIDALLLKEPKVFENKTVIDETKSESLPVKEDTTKKQESDSSQVIQLTPERKTSMENQKPKSWYHNYPLLWGTLIALFAWSAFLMYDHFSDKQAGLIISPEEKVKFGFLKDNFTPRDFKVRNETGTTIQIIGFVVIKSDSTEKGWKVEKIYKEYPKSLKQGESDIIKIGGKAIFADIVFDYTDERQSEEPIRMQFAGAMSKNYIDFSEKDNALEIRLPTQSPTRR